MGTSGTLTIYPAAMTFNATASNGYVSRVFVRASESTVGGAPIPAGAIIDRVEVVTPIFNVDGPFDEQGVACRVYLGTRAGGLDGFDLPGGEWTFDEQTIEFARWNVTPFSQSDWIADPTVVYEVDATGTQGPTDETAWTDDAGVVYVYWRKAGMKTNSSAVYGISKVVGAAAAIFGKAKRVTLGMIGDSTVVFQSYGWDAGYTRAAERLGIPIWGTPLHGAGESTGVGYYSVSSPNPQNGAYTGLPSEWQNWARNKSGDSGDLGALYNWFFVSNQAGGYFGLFVNGFAPFIRENLRLKFYYATTNATTAGSSIQIRTRKQNPATVAIYVRVWNFDYAAGGSFRLVLGGVETADIAWSTNRTTLAANIVAAVNATLGIADSTATVDAMTTNHPGYLVFTVGRSSSDLPTLSLNTGGLTRRYAGRPIEFAVSRIAPGGAYSTIGSDATIDADQAAGVAVAKYSKDIAANASRDYDVGLMPNFAGTTGTGPFLGLFQAAESTDRPAGVVTWPICAIGGQPTRLHASRLIAQTDAFLTEAFRAAADHAGYASPSLHPLPILIFDGLNDKNDGGNNSVGPSPAACNTRAGVLDNLKAIANRIDGIYDAAGWSKANLWYIGVGPQPTESDDSSITFYRNGWRDFVDWHPRAAYIDLSKLHGGFSTDVVELAGWNGSSDLNHPQAAGFDEWAFYALSSLRDAAAGGGRSRLTIGTRVGVV